MNLRHSNALLVQETGQAVSKILNVSRIMDTVVAVVQKHLYFNRGMIMLADQNPESAAVYFRFWLHRSAGEDPALIRSFTSISPIPGAIS